MAEQATEQTVARDNFEEYFAEKIWELVPSVYRLEDGKQGALSPDALRAFVEVLAEQAAILRRSHDRLWDDQFIDLADDWAVPYLADLVGTRLVSAQNKAGRRVDVAKTIYYRRRKGTLAVLEELIADIARWEGKVVENFRRIGRARHLLDPEPRAGRFSGTMQGGWADLRAAGIAKADTGPFGEFHHTPDIRQHRGLDGRYGIPKLAFHLYRLKVFEVEGAWPSLMSGTTGYTFDPSGRNSQLFMPRNRPSDWSDWHSALEWELPAPLPLRLLNHAEFVIVEEAVASLVSSPGISAAAASDLRTLRDITFESEDRLRETLGSLPSSAELLGSSVYAEIATLALVDDCGKAVLLSGDDGLPTLTSSALEVTESGSGQVKRQQTVGAGLGAWAIPATAASGRRLAVDPKCGRLLFLEGPDGPVTVDYHYGFSAEIGAGTYDRSAYLTGSADETVSGGGAGLNALSIPNSGVTQIEDSATYNPVSDKLAVRDLTVRAANRQRPYLRPDVNWVLNAADGSDARAELDGLWIGSAGGGLVLRAERFRDGVLHYGNYERVVIRHCTLDPGGKAADGTGIAPVPLLIAGRIEELVLQKCITGPIRTIEEGTVEKLIICDSIVQSTDPAVPAIQMGTGELHLRRVTAFGDIQAHRISASEALVTGTASVVDPQAGCFRFGAAAPGSLLPSPYKLYELTNARHCFTSISFGHPGYAQLSDSAPADLRTGAENGSEIGAFSSLNNPIKLDGLLAKAGEYMPFGLVPLMIAET